MIRAMPFRAPLIFCIPLLAGFPAHAESATHFQFEGEIARTYPFTHELPEGLYFHLIPISPMNAGWKIVINKNPKPDDPSFNSSTDNFADINPPLHGPNATTIDGGYFKDGKNPEFVEDHEFEFALSRDDDKAVWSEYCASVTNIEKPCKILPAPKRLGYATLHTNDHQLSGSFKEGYSPDQTLNIEHMKFTVSGYYEPPRKDFP